MGGETPAEHLGGREAIDNVGQDLPKRSADCLRVESTAMARVLIETRDGWEAVSPANTVRRELREIVPLSNITHVIVTVDHADTPYSRPILRVRRRSTSICTE